MTCELDCFDDSCQFQECTFSTSSLHPMGKDLREVEHHHDHHSKGDGDYTMATADMTESMGHHHHQPTDAGLFNKIWISSMIQPDPATWYSEE